MKPSLLSFLLILSAPPFIFAADALVLMGAAKEGYASLVQTLLAQGTDANAKIKAGASLCLPQTLCRLSSPRAPMRTPR